jgi:hypothetical protein
MARLRLAPVEFKVCHECSGPDSTYEGLKCVHCGADFREDRTMRVLRRLLILVDADPPPYEPALRFHCSGCGNYYELSSDWGDREADRFEAFQAARGMLRDPESLRESARSRNVDAETLEGKIRHKLGTVNCPLCGDPVNDMQCAPPRPTVVWVRNFELKGAEPQSRQWKDESDEEVIVSGRG